MAKVLIIYVNKKILALNHNSPHTKTIHKPQPFYFQTCITANAAKLWDDSTTIKPQSQTLWGRLLILNRLVRILHIISSVISFFFIGISSAISFYPKLLRALQLNQQLLMFLRDVQSSTPISPNYQFIKNKILSKVVLFVTSLFDISFFTNSTNFLFGFLYISLFLQL